jgi:hypothetical protein
VQNTAYTQTVLYNRIDNAVHEFVFLESSHAAVDVWIERLERIQSVAGRGEVSRLLFDCTSSGMLPMSYAFTRLQNMCRRMPQRTPSRTAFLYTTNFSVSVVDTFLKLLRADSAVRFFTLQQRDEALVWLRAND